MTKRAILYTRVSTDEQTRGYSLQSQLEAIRKYALEHQFEIAAEFTEDYTGTVPIEFRPEGKKAFDLLRAGEADAIIVYTMDRLVRPPEEGDEWDTPVLIRSLAKLGKEIHTTDDGQLKTDFASLLIAMLRAKSAGDERRKIIERCSRGRNTKAKENKVVGGGLTPYGYVYIDDRLVILEDEAKIVRMIYQWYIEDHLALYAISARLSSMGIPTPFEKRGKISHPGTWSPSAVHRIIRSETYKGKMRYGKRKGQNGNGGHRDSADTIVVDVPVIVPEDVWKAAQRIVDYNSEVAKRNRKNHYLLSGMVRCGCGRAMHAQVTRGYYYRCSEHATGPAGVKYRKCHEPMFDGNRLEEIVWNYIYKLLSSDFEAELAAAQEAEQRRQQPTLSEIEVVRKMLEETDREAEAIAGALSSVSGIVASKLKQDAEIINKRHADLTMKLVRLQSALEDAPLSAGQIEQLHEFRQRVFRGLDHATQEDKRKFYEILQVKATVTEGKVQVSCLIESSTLDRGG
jgi:site-specific DNA recombinase